ncbi:MAG: sugar-transfer associated ATP-grasp domain-containing protein [Pseudomonadota bacterium]
MTKLRRAFAYLLRMGFPWPGQRADPWSRAARHAVLARWPAALSPLIWVASSLIWPVSSLILSLNSAREARVGPRGLWLICWRAALTRNIPPREFVLYQLHLRGALDKPWRFETETSTLLGQITNPQTGQLSRDKRAFHDWMAGRGAPIVPLLDALQGDAVVSKPRYGGRGMRLTAWYRHARDRWQGQEAFGPGRETLAGADLHARIRAQDLLLQPLIPTDPAFGCLPVARVITCRKSDTADVLDALVQIPAKGDLASHRGAFRRVQVTTGEILRAGPGQRSLLSGGLRPEMPLEGQSLPHWAEILPHLTQAHEAMPPPCPLVGWDVIWGRDGPQILEANIGIAFTLFQIDRLEPMDLPEGLI